MYEVSLLFIAFVFLAGFTVGLFVGVAMGKPQGK